MNIKRASEIVEQVNKVIGRWKEYADEQQVDSGLRDAIDETLVRMNEG